MMMMMMMMVVVVVVDEFTLSWRDVLRLRGHVIVYRSHAEVSECTDDVHKSG